MNKEIEVEFSAVSTLINNAETPQFSDLSEAQLDELRIFEANTRAINKLVNRN